MKRFLASASTGTAGPVKKLKASSAAALPQQTLGLAEKLKHQEWTDLDDEGSRVLYWPRMLVKSSNRLLTSLLQEVPWEQVGSTAPEETLKNDLKITATN